jgi:hypothetical protein
MKLTVLYNDLLTEVKNELDKLKKNKIPLTDEEREIVMKAKAVWHYSPQNKPTPAIWKSKNTKTGEITYGTNTHRAYQTRKSLQAAINAFHNGIKQTA